MSDDIVHYGTPRHSGRYPWGSGEDPNQHTKDFLSEVEGLRKKGLSDVDIAKGMGLSTTDFRTRISRENAARREGLVGVALKLKEKGLSNVAIGKKMGINESSVRSLLDQSIHEKSQITRATADALKDAVDERKYIDVGAGVEVHLGVSRTKMDTAVSLLKEEEGYQVLYVDIKQVGTGKQTKMKVLVSPNTPASEVFQNRDKIALVGHYSEDGGRTFSAIKPIVHMDSKRIAIRYGGEGGKEKDGVIEIRRGVEDLSLGSSRYAQVRIGVDGTHYMKGMAMYTNDIPNGYDVIYNTNKPKGTPPGDVFKKVSSDPSNPFSSAIRQKEYLAKDGSTKRSPLNIVNEEGDWSTWSKTLSSQMLAKQRPSLVKKQLGLALDTRIEEYDEINALTNPTLKKHLLASSGGFADDCDAAAVHLKAAALPRQASHVILPFPKMKETEIYAPNYKNGEVVVLIRHPHGGIFEIPALIVNNKNKEARSLIEGAKDAVGIHPKVAEKLSGADFDGDTVLVIPSNNGEIQYSNSLKGLKNFDTKIAYPYREGIKTMSPHNKQTQMGDITNLITDMTIRGANEDELTRAVKHSMVVIDAEKHKLDWKRSYIEQDIAGLKVKYQGRANAGATTLLSRAKSQVRVDFRDERYSIDPKTGAKVYKYKPSIYVDKHGRTVSRKTLSTQMAETEDAFNLSSGMPVETIYANYANSLKSLANRSRLTAIRTEDTPYSPSARTTYQREVDTLKAKLELAIKNKPLERQAQLIANSEIRKRLKDNPEMDSDHIKKMKGEELAKARLRTGQKKSNIEITDREWEAIQAGAVSTNVLKQILINTDLESLKQRALPKTFKVMSPAKVSRARYMLAQGYTQAEVAGALGVSVGGLNKALE